MNFLKWGAILSCLFILASCRSAADAVLDAQTSRASGQHDNAIKFYVEAINKESDNPGFRDQLAQYLESLIAEQITEYKQAMQGQKPQVALDALKKAKAYKTAGASSARLPNIFANEKELRAKAFSLMRVQHFDAAEKLFQAKSWDDALAKLELITQQEPDAKDQEKFKSTKKKYRLAAYNFYWPTLQASLTAKDWFKAEKDLNTLKTYQDEVTSEFTEAKVHLRNEIYMIHFKDFDAKVKAQAWDDATLANKTVRAYADTETQKSSLISLENSLSDGLFHRSLQLAQVAKSEDNWLEALKNLDQAKPRLEKQKQDLVELREDYEEKALSELLEKVNNYNNFGQFEQSQKSFTNFENTAQLLSQARQGIVKQKSEDTYIAKLRILQDNYGPKKAYTYSKSLLEKGTNFTQFTRLHSELQSQVVDTAAIRFMNISGAPMEWSTRILLNQDFQLKQKQANGEFLSMLDPSELNRTCQQRMEQRRLGIDETLHIAKNLGIEILIIPELSSFKYTENKKSSKPVAVKTTTGAVMNLDLTQFSVSMNASIRFTAYAPLYTNKPILSSSAMPISSSVTIEKLISKTSQSKLQLSAKQAEVFNKFSKSAKAKLSDDFKNKASATLLNKCLKQLYAPMARLEEKAAFAQLENKMRTAPGDYSQWGLIHQILAINSQHTEAKRMKAKLQPVLDLKITPSDADVYLNGVKQSSARLLLEPKQAYQISVKKEGYKDNTFTFVTNHFGAKVVVKSLDFNPWKNQDLEIAGIKFKPIPAGDFIMGSPESELGRDKGETQRQVSLKPPFWIGQYEVTQSQWQSVMKENPSDFNAAGGSKGTIGNHDTSKFPIEMVSWYSCKRFISILNTKYVNKLPKGYKFDFPTGVQWEYACRAGSTKTFAGVLDEMAWYKENSAVGVGELIRRSQGRTHAVGTKKPNAWGLYDMYGNVEELCLDKYDPSAPNGQFSDYYLCKGGSWRSASKDCRSASRGRSLERMGFNNTGLRLAIVRVSVDSKVQQSQNLEIKKDSPSVEVIQDSPKDRQDIDVDQNIQSAWESQDLEIAGIKFKPIDKGAFMMGSSKSNGVILARQEFQHRVTLTQPFWMGKYEVTQAQWENIMGNNPSHFKGAKLPVENVSWDDCQSFVAKLNSRYANQFPEGYQFALPTEAQWEYACRAGTTTVFYCGDKITEDQLNHNARFKGEGKTKIVGSYRPNAWGLYDMHGNIGEWCQDWHGASYYSNSVSSDPTGASTGSYRVYRGGSWYESSRYCRAARRGMVSPRRGGKCIGLRLSLSRSSR